MLEPAVERPVHPARQMAQLVAGVRAAVSAQEDWDDAVQRVTRALRRHLPTPAVLSAAQRRGDPSGYRSHVLHAERDGSFSIVALVWLPGQVTPIHDHLTWCVFGVIQGAEREERFMLDDGRLVPTGLDVNRDGDVSGAAPPGDIHRVRNVGDETAISIHVYGTDVSRMGSSVRRVYPQPVATP
jgi:predicted metal-dependent enzyme (double-stranded beta helix superfamily)